MEFRKAKIVSLKAHPSLNEKWLQARLAEDPSLLGLGEGLIFKDAERRQPRAGRLDLLFSDPEANTRYEVEVQLGARMRRTSFGPSSTEIWSAPGIRSMSTSPSSSPRT